VRYGATLQKLTLLPSSLHDMRLRPSAPNFAISSSLPNITITSSTARMERVLLRQGVAARAALAHRPEPQPTPGPFLRPQLRVSGRPPRLWRLLGGRALRIPPVLHRHFDRAPERGLRGLCVGSRYCRSWAPSQQIVPPQRRGQLPARRGIARHAQVVLVVSFIQQNPPRKSRPYPHPRS